MTTIRITDDTATDTVRDVIEARTRRLMAELSRVPDQWPTRVAHAELLVSISESLDEWLALNR